MGTVFTVKLVKNSTKKAIGMYACKVVLKSFIQSKNTEKRQMDLKREIDMLKLADEETSVKFIEHIEQQDRTVLIQAFANALNLNHLLGIRGGAIEEREAQIIIQKLAKGLKILYDKRIIHRDLNVNNVMLHIPELEPDEVDLMDLEEYRYEKLFA